MYKWFRGALHGTAEETARQIRGLSYKVFIVTWEQPSFIISPEITMKTDSLSEWRKGEKATLFL